MCRQSSNRENTSLLRAGSFSRMPTPHGLAMFSELQRISCDGLISIDEQGWLSCKGLTLKRACLNSPRRTQHLPRAQVPGSAQRLNAQRTKFVRVASVIFVAQIAPHRSSTSPQRNFKTLSKAFPRCTCGSFDPEAAKLPSGHVGTSCGR